VWEKGKGLGKAPLKNDLIGAFWLNVCGRAGTGQGGASGARDCGRLPARQAGASSNFGCGRFRAMTDMLNELRGPGFAGAAQIPSPCPPAVSFLGRRGVYFWHPTTMTPADNQARGEVTELLRLWRAGDPGAEARLFEAVLPRCASRRATG